MRKRTETRLVDAMISAYVDWREVCLVVHDRYRSWASATGSQARVAFWRYLAALDARNTPLRSMPISSTIRALLDLARTHGMRVVYSQDTHGEGDPEWRIWPEQAREGSWGWEILDELAPARDDVVLRRPRYDAFYGTSLDQLLRHGGVDTLVICGTVANICVHYTAASAALHWYDVVIPRDAISALDPFDLESSLRQTAFVFAGRITTAAGVRV